jgi:hypothetical protein
MTNDQQVIDESIPAPTAEDYAAVAAALKTETPAEDTPADASTAEDGSDDTVGNEAAKYRRRLRDTESERDTLKARLENFQRGEVERLAAAKITDPADVWRDGARVADVLDDDGNIDAAKVDGLVNGLVAQHPHWVAPRAPQLGTRSGSGASGPGDHRQPSWASALNPPRGEQ